MLLGTKPVMIEDSIANFPAILVNHDKVGRTCFALEPQPNGI